MPQLRRVASWTKANAHAVRIVGGLFFVGALVAGLIWSLGSDIEPVAFLLGLLSSMFLAAPSVAEFVLPSRKPISQMNFEELLSFIQTTTREDWKHVATDWAEEAFLKEDPKLRIRCRLDTLGIHNANLQEPWANNHPDPHATSYWYELYNDGALIERFILVSVDGARATLPLPEANRRDVPYLRYKIAQIVDDQQTLDDYMGRSGLRVTAP